MIVNKRTKRRRIPIESQNPKRRRKGKRGLYAIPIFLIALIVGTILCCTVLFKIETVTVEGNTRYTADQVIAASGIETGENLLRLKKSKVIDGITDNLVYAETVTIQKRLPNEILIIVSEPTRTAVITLGASNEVLISGKGRVLEYGYGGSGIRYEGLSDMVIESGFVVTDDAGALERINTIAKAFEDGMLAQITAIGTTSATGNYVVWADRIKIMLGSVEELTQKVKFAKYFIENELGDNETGVADVSAGKQLYFDPGVLNGYAEEPIQSIPEKSLSLESASVNSSTVNSAD